MAQKNHCVRHTTAKLETFEPSLVGQGSAPKGRAAIGNIFTTQARIASRGRNDRSVGPQRLQIGK